MISCLIYELIPFSIKNLVLLESSIISKTLNFPKFLKIQRYQASNYPSEHNTSSRWIFHRIPCILDRLAMGSFQVFSRFFRPLDRKQQTGPLPPVRRHALQWSYTFENQTERSPVRRILAAALFVRTCKQWNYPFPVRIYPDDSWPVADLPAGKHVRWRARISAPKDRYTHTSFMKLQSFLLACPTNSCDFFKQAIDRTSDRFHPMTERQSFVRIGWRIRKTVIDLILNQRYRRHDGRTRTMRRVTRQRAA